MEIITWPFRALLALVAGILGFTGRLLGICLGLVLMFVGMVLTMTVIGAVVGIPLIILGALLIIRALF